MRGCKYASEQVSLDSLKDVSGYECILERLMLVDDFHWNHIEHSLRTPNLDAESIEIRDPNEDEDCKDEDHVETEDDDLRLASRVKEVCCSVQQFLVQLSKSRRQVRNLRKDTIVNRS